MAHKRLPNDLDHIHEQICFLRLPSTKIHDVMAPSLLPPSLVTAYQETWYMVPCLDQLTLRIGQPHEDLRRIHHQHGVDCSAFVTAWNTWGTTLTAEENLLRHRRLINDLSRQHLTFFEGIGQHPTNGWPGEVSLLILGLTQDAAIALGITHQQNAIVWNDAEGVPHLILLR